MTIGRHIFPAPHLSKPYKSPLHLKTPSPTDNNVSFFLSSCQLRAGNLSDQNAYTVELRSKGPATKGNRSLRDNGAWSRLSPFSFLLFGAPARWDTAIREISAFGKDFLVPWTIFPRSERFFFFVTNERMMTRMR